MFIEINSRHYIETESLINAFIKELEMNDDPIVVRRINESIQAELANSNYVINKTADMIASILLNEKK